MLVKESEWDELLNIKEKLQKNFENSLQTKDEEIKKLNTLVEELKSQNKPDYIEINIYKREVDRLGYWKDQCSVQIEQSKLKLSSGLRSQILRIFRNSLNEIYKDYNEKIMVLNKQKE